MAREKLGSAADDDSDDDIPLRTLRDTRYHRNSTVTRTPGDIWIPEERVSNEQGETSTASSGYTPQVSPFPLHVSPFIPTSATEAGEDDEDYVVASTALEREDCERVSTEWDDTQVRLLAPHGSGTADSSLFAKSSSGGIRWCKKCDRWKPDRCHHCSQCKQCTLKSEYFHS